MTLATGATGRVTRIIRFLSEGKVYMGEQPPAGSREAAVVSGDIYSPQGVERTGEVRLVEQLLAPVVPTQIFCIGLNYMKHYNESAKKRGIPLPEKPAIFVKAVSSLNNPEGPVWIPKLPRGGEMDYEVELAVVIGRACKDVPAADALNYVAGYTVSNDFTSRHWQKNSGAGQWNKGKSFDTFTPLGPALVTPDVLADPQALDVSCSVNGEVRQSSNTKDMIHSVATIIEWLSTDMTLTPGTVILTGTPEGVAAGMAKPDWLKPGDIVETTIEKIGSIRNYITTPLEIGAAKM